MVNVELGSKSTDADNLDQDATVSKLNDDSVDEDEHHESNSNCLPDKK